jgi:hypothetical protein
MLITSAALPAPTAVRLAVTVKVLAVALPGMRRVIGLTLFTFRMELVSRLERVARGCVDPEAGAGLVGPWTVTPAQVPAVWEYSEFDS